jgi:quercetin dioxygenase-like cupin family protein
MKRKFYLLSTGLVLGASGLWILHAQEKQNPNFTGTVVRLEETSNSSIAHFRFEPGSRTKWHSHEGGQIILVEEGVGLTQVKGGPVVELHAGETTYVGPGVVHWHGAAPDKGGVQFNVSRGGITWLGEVTDAEFRAKPKR